MLKLHWTAEYPLLLKKFLKQQGVSRRLLARLKFHEGKILVNGQLTPVNYQLAVGDEVTVVLPPEGKQPDILPISYPLDILFEDEHYIVVNKPAGYTSLPSSYNPQGSLANMLKAYYIDQGYDNQVIHVVTRLDRDTSGAMLFAKHRYAHSLIDHVVTHQAIEKRYLAFTKIPLAAKTGQISAPIARKPGSIIERCVSETGKRAITSYALREETPLYMAYDVWLHTGRTHQIRVHFSHAGAPLIADDLYGGPPSPWLGRQALHCAKLKFTHPLTGDTLSLKAPLPADLKNFLAAGQKAQAR